MTSAALRVGSMFSGFGGLDDGVTAAIGGAVAWYCEIEPAARRLLEHHSPDTPNHGDVTAVDWATVEPVDVLTMGFPCQDVSSAGRRLGLRPGTRSGLWSHGAYAVAQLRPALVVIENVRGLLSADAHCDLEPCPWCLGDDEGRPLRALGAVLGDLASMGYVGRWCGLRAADVGAPHGRFRVFIAAWPAHTDAALVGRGPAWGDDRLRAEGLVAGAAADTNCVESERWGGVGVVGGAAAAEPREGDQWQRAGNAAGDRGADASDPDGFGPVRGGGTRGRRGGPADHGLAVADSPCDGRDEGRAGAARLVGGPDAALGGHGAAPYTTGAGREGSGSEPARGGSQRGHRPAAADTVRDGREGSAELDRRPEGGQPAPCGGDTAGRVLDANGGQPSGAVAADSHCGGDPEISARPDPLDRERPQVGRRPVEPAGAARGDEPASGGEATEPAGRRGSATGNPTAARCDWGPYEPAIRRWVLILGRDAPAPTVTGTRGGQQLSARFVEWMMGLPEGHVTAVPGLSRNEQLKLLGNGVVPRQAEAALRTLLSAPAAAGVAA